MPPITQNVWMGGLIGFSYATTQIRRETEAKFIIIDEKMKSLPLLSRDTLEKLNVKLTYQTLSASVASVIEFLREDIKLPQFQESEATTMFIYLTKVLDLCNSSNPFGKGYKSPITVVNWKVKEQNVKEAVEYIKRLKDISRKPLVSGRRKTGFIGFLCT